MQQNKFELQKIFISNLIGYLKPSFYKNYFRSYFNNKFSAGL